jgi:ribosomal protein S14
MAGPVMATYRESRLVSCAACGVEHVYAEVRIHRSMFDLCRACVLELAAQIHEFVARRRAVDPLVQLAQGETAKAVGGDVAPSDRG